MGGPPETGDFLVNKKGGSPEKEDENEEENTDVQQPKQQTAQQQAEIAVFMAGNKQQQLLQIQKEKSELENRLGELEKNLTNFKNSKLGGFFSIFQPKIKLLIDTILEEMKKGARNLSDIQKVGYYTGLIVAVSSLIGILTALKMVAAVLDAIFSWLTKAIPSCFTCVGCIILILIFPLYVPFFAVIFMLGAIPLLKGRLTKIDADLIKDLKKQRTAWQAELDVIKKKVTLRKQIKALSFAEKQVKRQK